MRLWALAILEWSIVALCLLAPICLLPLALFIIGTRQMALSVIGHDAAHAKQNVLASLCLWPMGVGLHAFKAHHWAHHRNVGGSTDPEVPHREISERALAKYGRWLYPLDLLGFGSLHAYRLWRLFPPRHWLDGTGPLLLCALILLAPHGWLWFLAIPTTYFAAFRQRAFTEHLGKHTFRQTKPSLWARLTYLPHGTWQHWEHHFP